MASGNNIQRYVYVEFPCKKCGTINTARIDLLHDLYHKAKNPPVSAGNQQPSYYERICVNCQTNNEVLWKGDITH